jgi:hypothetical protein
MKTAEQGWDLLYTDIMGKYPELSTISALRTFERCLTLFNFWIFIEPLGYDETQRELFPREDLIQLAGDDCKDLISSCRKICHNLAIKDSRTSDVRELIQRMDLLSELVVDLQASSARDAAQMSLSMCLAHAPTLDINMATTGIPPDADANALLDACSGYDTRIARRIRHEEFYDKVVLPEDEPLEAELEKERKAEARPTGSEEFTWTSSKEVEKNKSKGNDIGASSPTKQAEDSDDDVVSSPAKEAETDKPRTDDEARSSPVKEK